jgi:predicted deacetylase
MQKYGIKKFNWFIARSFLISEGWSNLLHKKLLRFTRNDNLKC